MKPLDPRLMRYAHSTRRYIIITAVLGTLSAVLIVAQIVAIAEAISPIITGEATVRDVARPITFLVAIVLARVAVSFSVKMIGHRAATQAVRELRNEVLAAASARGPRWLAHHGRDTVTLITRGLDDLGPYFVSFIPQLILTCTVTPIVIAVILWVDWISAIFALVTIPFIPIFMILIGKLTQDYSRDKLATMEKLGTQLLDIIAGLPTLRALGREHAPEHHIHTLGQRHARTTMQTLRVAFLSGAALEFLATLSVALVAVEVGLRIVGAQLGLLPGLIIIMAAPEVYAPLREVGKHYHASADGVAAAEAAFAVIEDCTQPGGTAPAPNLTTSTIHLAEVSTAARGMWAPYRVSATIAPGTICALTGASGAGKTTTVYNLLGLVPPTAGTITVHTEDGCDVALADIDRESWWRQITWVPQTPALLPGTIRDNVTLGAHLDDELLNDAATATGFDAVINDLADGWDTVIGSHGTGLSVGQRQRLALTRALVSDSTCVVLDEPTAHLDSMSEDRVIATITRLRDNGRTVIVIAHRRRVVDLADTVIPVTSMPASEEDRQRFPELVQSSIETLELTPMPRLLADDLDPAINSTTTGAGGDR